MRGEEDRDRREVRRLGEVRDKTAAIGTKRTRFNKARMTAPGRAFLIVLREGSLSDVLELWLGRRLGLPYQPRIARDLT
jgi:hypothetical protein